MTGNKTGKLDRIGRIIGAIPVQSALEFFNGRGFNLKIWGDPVTVANLGICGIIIIPKMGEHPGRVFRPGQFLLLNPSNVIRDVAQIVTDVG